MSEIVDKDNRSFMSCILYLLAVLDKSPVYIPEIGTRQVDLVMIAADNSVPIKYMNGFFQNAINADLTNKLSQLPVSTRK